MGGRAAGLILFRQPKPVQPIHNAISMDNIIGFAAACLTTVSFVPQAWHTFRTKDVSGISLSMYACFPLGVFLWLVYGLLMDAWPIVVANA